MQVIQIHSVFFALGTSSGFVLCFLYCYSCFCCQIFTLAVFLSQLCCITVLPALFAVTVPVEDTVATFVLLDFQSSFLFEAVFGKTALLE